MSKMRIIIAGGGTGGHIFPAVAIGHALQRIAEGTQLLFVGAKGKMEMEKVPQEGFEIVGLDIAGFNRSNILKNLALPFKLIKSRSQARKILKEFKPNAVVGVGGYASFPVLSAAQGMNIPTLIQEQNSFAGKSNKILAKKAKAVCVAYEHMERFFPKDKLVMTGNPVRKKISDMRITRGEGQDWLGLDKGKTTLLVVGGSLGAKSINEAIDARMEEILADDVQVIWQTGKPYYEQAKNRAESFKGKVKVFEFIKEMDYAYAAADVVISRAGALAIAELCIAAKPVVFVPYPFAAEDHQTSNAMALVEHNAAMMVKDNDAKSELVKKLKTLLHDSAMQDVMSKSLHMLAIKDADERIARKVIEIATKT
ncbi:MAG: undecaprenyldiphospho-muramoylpentapeptide beta-N-acetylglucosaminyltransferase [Bacteroidetes bacterium]|nr:undecaprenyldiphospho-muramoylpentapeptide beta-N-acetylglucosaminyltransferase [Bacteroidota bacterium]